jgi:hypothetical protein
MSKPGMLMKYKNTYHKICPICGKVFDTGRDNQSYCSPECCLEQKRRTCREYRLKKKEAKPKARKILSVQEINARARAEGKSYGQYVSEMASRREA